MNMGSVVFAGWLVIQVLIGFNLVWPMLLFVIHTFSRRRKQVSQLTEKQADYAIIVTAYQQTDLLPTVVESLLQLHYNNYLIYIVADNCDISNLHFSDPRVILLRPESILASNTKSHFYAIMNFRRNHDRLTIIDSDNLVAPDYLNQLNIYFDKNYEAVQGVRSAKNLDTTIARLDAARDVYYHFYDGRLLFGSGSSATLAGSGMAFTTELYRDCLEKLEIDGAGFDKVLQYEIVRRGKRIAFSEKAVVYDAKTSNSDQLVKQRSRWINTWFRYFYFGFKLLGKGLITFNWNKILFGITLLRPPLFIFLLLSALFMFVNIFISITAVIIWASAFFLFILGFFLALKYEKADDRIYKALKGVPRFMFLQILSLLNSKNASKKSVATKHYTFDLNTEDQKKAQEL